MNFKKINKRIEDMFDKGEFDDDFINITLSKSSTEKLKSYQILHVYNLISCLKKRDIKCVLDGSSTGTGKTYTTVCVFSELRYLTPLIICPKSTINIWKTVCEYFGVKPLAIVNYETIKLGEIYDSDGKRIKAPFLSKTANNNKYEWNFANNKNTVIVFDEAHKCKNKATLNGKLLLAAKNRCRVMLLSATISDTVENFMIFGYMLDLYSSVARGRNWIKNVIREDKNALNTRISTLNKYIYPDRGSRMTIEDIGDKFPKNQVVAECYTLDNKSCKEIDNEYNKIKESRQNTDAKELVAILRCRQRIELLKIPIILEQLQKYLEIGKSVTVFVNFVETLQRIVKMLKDNKIEYATIHGRQTGDERDTEINKFQTNAVKVIVCMIQCGSVGISLHDTSGGHPRVSLISPSFSSVDLVQTLGRIYRIGIVAPVLQRIIYCADTYETVICQKVKQKLNFINYLSDEDLIHF